MKNNNFIVELIISLILIILAVFLLNPFSWWMPDMIVKMMAVIFLVIFAVFAGFIWREKPRDEREVLHRMLSGRAAFLAGTSVLVIGIIYQELFSSPVDPWLVASLGIIILAKLGSLVYSQMKR